MRQILFVCAGNTCRSPMAQAIASTLLGGSGVSQSAGIDAAQGMHATREAIHIMRERGLDISSHRSRSITGLNLAEFDMIVAMTPAIAEELRRNHALDDAKLKVLTIRDPYGHGLEAYRLRAAEIESALRAILA
jgi:protein-tyrosine-phosphatase